MTVVKLSFLLYYPVSGFVFQTASRCESRAKCRDTSMHWRMIRIDTDFRFKNTDPPPPRNCGMSGYVRYGVSDYGHIRLVKFRPTILGSAHFRTVKMLLTEAGQSNGKFCPRSNLKYGDLD